MIKMPCLTWISDSKDYRVHIHRRCFLKMRRLALEHTPMEVGTSLIGYYSRDGRTAFITSLAPLPQDSEGTRYTFVRGIVGLAEHLTAVFRRFRGKRYRVGEWHSHPNAAPIPSSTDDRFQCSLAADVCEQLPEAILLIIGDNFRDRPALGVYVYSRIRGRVDLEPAVESKTL
jgi:integrative and conjugative element protein (TIGR02256 family)